MIYVLDTDHLSILDQDTLEGFNLGRRLAVLSPEEVVVTIVTYEEQMRGWLAYLTRATTPARQVEAYRKLRLHVERFLNIPLLDYDDKAAREFARLRQEHVRIGTMDLKIAAIVLANRATLLSRNLVDFGKVPDLHVEDWSL